MTSLRFDDEIKEDDFFDARECSVSSSPCDDELDLSSNFDYKLWTRTPKSVQQRRKQFFNEMGFDSNGSIQGDIDRITKNSEAELRTPSFDCEFFSSFSSNNSTDHLSISHECNEIENLSGEANCGENDLENEKDGKGVGAKMIGIKKKLLNKLNLMKKIVYKRGVPMKGDEAERVKVQFRRKKLKELSALFVGQDIPAHKGLILTMKFSLDGKYLATGGEDGVVRVWQVVLDTKLSDIDPSKFDPSCIYLRVNDRSQLAPFISQNEKSAKFRKTADSACVVLPPAVFRILEEPIHEFLGHSDDILDLSWSNNNSLLSASTDNTIRMWQVGCENCLKVFRHNNYVTCVQFNPRDDKRFVSGSLDGKIRIWEISSCQVVGWTYIREIVTAVCYRPSGQGLVVGSIGGTCRFYSTKDDYFQLEARIDLHAKKKAQCRKITGFQFFPQDHDKLMVTSACSRVRILHGINVIGKFKGNRTSGNQLLASFTPDGKHIVSTSGDSNIYLWSCINQFNISRLQPKTLSSWERFSANASLAIPWFGFRNVISNSSRDEDMISVQLPLASPSSFSLGKDIVLESPTKGSATWPEEKLVCPFMRKSDYKFLKSCQKNSRTHAWNMVIVSAGWDGRIRSFHNYGLPVVL